MAVAHPPGSLPERPAGTMAPTRPVFRTMLSSPMLRYIAGRVLLAVPTMIGVSIVVFFTIKLIPGDPVAALLGPRSTEAARAEVMKQYGLDRSLPLQYVTWLGNVVQWDFGFSIAQARPVSEVVGPAFLNTLKLTGFAALVTVAGGTVLGSVMAFAKAKPLRAVASGIAIVAASTPQYSLGLILIVVVSLNLEWLPAGGMGAAASAATASEPFIKYLLLPGLTAAAIPMGIVARMFAAAVSDEAAQPYVESDRARGLPESRVRLHILHGSLASLLTISGLQIGYLLGGVVFVEVVFSWPGIGQLVFQAITARDYAVIQTGILLAAFGFVGLNLVVDVLRALLDPRVQRSGITT